jgi:hypothetical protein
VRRRRWTARLRAAGRYLVEGLAMLDHTAHLAARAAGADGAEPPAERRPAPPRIRRLTGPPPGHPDRLVPHVPPSDVERALFAQLWPG